MMIAQLQTRLLSIIALTPIAVVAIGCEQNSSKTPVQVAQFQLSEIVDGTSAEGRGYDYLLMHAAEVNKTELEKAGLVIPYHKLTSNPAEFRGQPVNIRGLLWRLHDFPANGMVFLEHLYEAWIVSDEGQFYRVVCSQLPQNLHPGDKLRSVKLTGYFWGIESHGESIFAPTLLSQTIVVTEEATHSPKLRVNFPISNLKSQITPSSELKLELKSDKSGKLLQLALGPTTFGNDDAAFDRLNAEILTIIGRPGSAVARFITIVIDADFECDYKFIAKAVASCAGRYDPVLKEQVRYMQNIRFAVPHDPKE